MFYALKIKKNPEILYGFLFPLVLITGPALPDIFVSFSALFTIYYIFKKKNLILFNEKIFVMSWLSK